MTQTNARDMLQKLENAFPDQQNIHAQETLAVLSQKLANVSDKEFLTALTLASAHALDADYFLVGRLNPFSNIMRTVRFWSEGAMADSVHYSLDGTPCAKVLDGEACVYADNAAELFPRDDFLQENKIAGYVGAPLISSSGEPFGIIVGLTKAPIADESFAHAIIDHFRARAAAALETEEILDRYSWVIAEASDGVWDWDVVTGGTVISERIQALLGYDSGQGPYDLMQIEKSIHPDDRNTQVEALKNHLNCNTPYDIKIRIRDRSGVYRWFRSRGKAIRTAAGKPIRMIGSFSDIDDVMMEAKRHLNKG